MWRKVNHGTPNRLLLWVVLLALVLGLCAVLTSQDFPERLQCEMEPPKSLSCQLDYRTE